MRKFIVAFCILVLVSGCAGQPKKQGQPGSATTQNRQIRTQQTSPEQKDQLGAQAIAYRLATLAKSVPQVNAANCVVMGNMAIVGIDVDGNLDRSRVGTIKYSVAEALNKDPHGKNALVTADVDMNHRLREIAEDIRRGHPVMGFANELADMIGRIMPQLPRDTMPMKEREPNRSRDREQLKQKHL